MEQQQQDTAPSETLADDEHIQLVGSVQCRNLFHKVFHHSSIHVRGILGITRVHVLSEP
jgi:hypothetical protein